LKVNADAITVLKRADFQERLLKDGVEGVGNTPEQFAAQIRADLGDLGARGQGLGREDGVARRCAAAGHCRPQRFTA
jgi:tripartite-type tricarboxylate transporter receptor subunit TctC